MRFSKYLKILYISLKISGYLHLDLISRQLKILWIALIVLSMHLGENRRWVPLFF